MIVEKTYPQSQVLIDNNGYGGLPLAIINGLNLSTFKNVFSVILYCVCVFSITLGLIADMVGLVSPIVTDPPKDTADPFIVIEEFASFALTTEPSGKVKVPLDASNVAPAGTVIVSPFSPTCNDVPDWGIILSTSIWLII